MDLLGWALFGIVAGGIAFMLDPYPGEGGLGGALLLGIFGAVVGGVVANLVFGGAVVGFSITSFTLAVLGAVLLLGLRRAIQEV